MFFIDKIYTQKAILKGISNITWFDIEASLEGLCLFSSLFWFGEVGKVGVSFAEEEADFFDFSKKKFTEKGINNFYCLEMLY